MIQPVGRSRKQPLSDHATTEGQLMSETQGDATRKFEEGLKKFEPLAL